MNKLKEIFESWAISFNPTDKQLELAGNRMIICDSCEFKKTNPIIHCSVCGCALKAKIYSPVIGACPKDKWLKVEREWQAKIKEQTILEEYNKLKKGV